MNREPLFTFSDVQGGYGGGIVVRGIDGTVDSSEILCVLGRNGVGKSTLLKRLYGFLRGRGKVRLAGRDIDLLDPTARSHLGITFAPQERVVFDDLSVFDNLTLMRPDRRLDDFAIYFQHFPRLQERLGQIAGTLSGGERKILSFVRALSEGKSLVMLDEPSEGVQRENIEHMSELLNEHKQRGTAFIIVEQNLQMVETIADRIMILDQGRCVLTGRRKDISREDITSHLSI